MRGGIEPDLQDVGYGQAVAEHSGAKNGFLIGRNPDMDVGTAVRVLNRQPQLLQYIEVQTLQVNVRWHPANESETERVGGSKEAHATAWLRL